MGTQGTMTSPGRGTQRNWLVVSWPRPARTLTDSWKVRGQVAFESFFESSDRFNAPLSNPVSPHDFRSRCAVGLARSFFSHCIRQRSHPRRVPLNPEEYFSHPSSIVHVSLRTLAHLWSLPLSFSLFSTYLLDLCLSTTNGLFFSSFLFFSFFSSKHDSRTKRRPLSGRGKREALLSRPVFLANAPKLEAQGVEISSPSIVSLERDRLRWY